MNVKIEIIINGESVSCSSPVVSSDTPVVSDTSNPEILSDTNNDRLFGQVTKFVGVVGTPIKDELITYLAYLGAVITKEGEYYGISSGTFIFYKMIVSSFLAGEATYALEQNGYRTFDTLDKAKEFYNVK